MEHLDAELEKRGWSRYELTKRAGLSNSYFSMVSGGSRNIGIEACKKIARALHLSVDVVLGWAGLLPEQPEGDLVTDELFTLAKSLPAEEQKLARDFLRLLHERRKGIDRGPFAPG